MLDPRFVLLGAALTLFGSCRYALSTLRGRTQPNRVTWGLWAAAPLIGFAAQLDHGVGLSSVMTLSVGVGPAIVFVASFVARNAYWRLSRFDIVCGAVSVLALVVWLGLDDPVLAVVVAVLADAMGALPTVRKAWVAPDSENPLAFSLSGANGLITLLTLDDWGVASWAFPVYILAIGLVLTLILALRGRFATG